jgi:hypothetical protein
LCLHMPVYDSVRGQLIRLQAELLNILKRMVVAQRRTNFWAPWCVYFHDCLASRTFSGCMVVFILFCDEVEGCIGVYTDWHESSRNILAGAVRGVSHVSGACRVGYPVCRRRCELEQRAPRGCKDSSSLRVRIGHQRRHLSSGNTPLFGRSGVSSAICPLLGRYDS